jgi:hypothetical protein
MPVAGARILSKIKKAHAGWMGGCLIRLTRGRLLGVLPPVLPARLAREQHYELAHAENR